MNFQSTLSRAAQTVAALGLAVVLGACASKGVAPVAELATARASIAQAESAGAREAAPVEFLAARDTLAKAETAAREERFSDARRLAARAEVDGEVAERKARAVKAQPAATELARSNELLRKEIARKSGG